MINVALFSWTYVYVTIKLLAHCHTLALFPQSQTSPTTTTTTTTTTTFTFRLHSQCIHNGSGLPLLCVIVNANERQKWGRLRTRLVTLYIQALYLCFVVSLFSLSCSWTNTWASMQVNICVVINCLWLNELTSLKIWSVELAGLEVVMKLCTCLL